MMTRICEAWLRQPRWFRWSTQLYFSLPITMALSLDDVPWSVACHWPGREPQWCASVLPSPLGCLLNNIGAVGCVIDKINHEEWTAYRELRGIWRQDPAYQQRLKAKQEALREPRRQRIAERMQRLGRKPDGRPLSIAPPSQ